jgi:hypothetical protein
MMNTLILVNGPWQAVMCIAALKSSPSNGENANIYCLLVDMQNDSRMHRVTEKLLAASGISNIFFIPKKTSLRAAAKKVSIIERHFQMRFSQMDDILLFGYHRAIARFFLRQCADARITIYEEGVRTYTAPVFPKKKGIPDLLRRLRAAIQPPYQQAMMDPQYYLRTNNICLLISNLLPLPDVYPTASRIPIAPTIVVEVMQAARIPKINWSHSKKMVLIVGQYYSLLKQMSKETERRLYRNAVEKILESGYLPVWRGHIRETDMLFKKLKSRCPELINFSDIVDDPHYPVEFYAVGLQDTCRAVASLSSSSLYYFRQITDISTYSLLNDTILSVMTPPHYETCALAQKYVAPFRSFRPED